MPAIPPQHYVDNKRFVQLIREFHERRKLNPAERIPEEIGKYLIAMSERLASRYNFANYCVDQDTEALTDSGWKRYDEISESDRILSYDKEARCYAWSPLLDLHISKYKGLMHHLTNKNAGLDCLVTPHHKMMTLERGLVEVEKLKTSDHIILRANPLIDPDKPRYDDAFVSLVGWAITEGHYVTSPVWKRCNVNFYQNEGDKSNVIRGLLNELGIPYREHKRFNSKIVEWTCKDSPLIRLIHEVSPNRVLTSEFILSLPQKQRLLLIDAMIAGDGSVDKHGVRQYVQKDKIHMDQFVFLCTIAGFRTSVRLENLFAFGKIRSFYTCYVTDKRGKHCRIESTDFHGGFDSTKGYHGAINKNNHPVVPYDGVIWCPQTAYGCFVCRRGQNVYITGNTYRDEFVADGILRAVEAFKSFDPEKSSNPFAYFTKVIYRIFVQRIKKEKAERQMRDELIMVDEIFTLQDGDDCKVTRDQIIGDFQFDSMGLGV